MICTLCPRMCAAERNDKGGSGYCSMGSTAVVSRVAPHMWEEPCLSGTKGCGTVFFGGCSLGCVYCQNHDISHEKQGKMMSDAELAQRIYDLEQTGVHNIAFVTGTHFVPNILRALEIYRPKVPIVWNSGGYETLETIKMLEGTVDIYLPDLKLMSPRLGKVLCNAQDYFECASQAILEMQRQTGEAQYDENGMMTRGTIVRHLVLPGCTGDSLKVLDWIHDNMSASVPVSIMRQYTPMPHCTVRGLDRRVTDEEYERVVNHAIDLQLHALTQEKEAAESTFIPDFDLR